MRHRQAAAFRSREEEEAEMAEIDAVKPPRRSASLTVTRLANVGSYLPLTPLHIAS